MALIAIALPAAAYAADPAIGLPVKLYSTNIPRSFDLLYQLQRGGVRGSGEFSWKRSEDSYDARLKGAVAGFTVLDWGSTGAFDAAGIAPQRYVEHRLGKSDRDVTFHKAESKIRFSGKKSPDIPFVDGVQDRLTWMVQLPAILAADPVKVTRGSRIDIYVVGTRGSAGTWSFESAGDETVSTPAGVVHAVKWVRKWRSTADTQVEVWLDPARNFLPVRLRLATPKMGTPLELTLTDANGN